MPLPVDPTTGLPIAPHVPPGWSISSEGIPIDPGGIAHPELVSATAASPSDLPIASMAVVGAAGYFLGKPRGQANLWAGIGAALGYVLKPLE